MAGIKQINRGVVEGFTNDRWLLKQIDSQLGNTQPPQRSDVFYPSLLGNTCDRYLYIAYNGMAPEQDITAQTQRTHQAVKLSSKKTKVIAQLLMLHQLGFITRKMNY